MMDILTKNDVMALLKGGKGKHLSLYMPTNRAWKATTTDQILFKDQIRKAQELLIDSGLSHTEAEGLLEQPRALMKDRKFWETQSDGLALFASDDGLLVFRLPHPFKETLVVGSSFHVWPLLELFSGDGKFYLLSLSQNRIQLYQGSRFSLDEVELKNAPHSMEEAARYLVFERHPRFIGTARGRGKRQPFLMQGHGIGVDDMDTEVFHFFRQVDQGLKNILHDEKAPLVLAGVDALLPVYRKANTYQYLEEAHLSGNLQNENMRLEELHRHAWELVRDRFDEAKQKALARYTLYVNSGSKLVSGDIKDILPAAHGGKVATLFVVPGGRLWGTFDTSTEQAEVHENEKAGDADLYNFAAMHTLLHRGEVFIVEKGRLPSDVVALFRP